MLKFPRSLDEIDPISDNLFPHWDDWDLGLLTRAAKRHHDEWAAQVEKILGDDWEKIPGRPHWFRNGKGQLRYAPPLPPKTPKTLTPKRYYSWVGRREPKLGDFVKKVDWPNYCEVIAETDTQVTLDDKASRAHWDYHKDADWLFMVKEDETPPFQPGDTIIPTLHTLHSSPTAKVVECVKYKDFWPKLQARVKIPAYPHRFNDWVVCYGELSEWDFADNVERVKA